MMNSQINASTAIYRHVNLEDGNHQLIGEHHQQAKKKNGSSEESSSIHNSGLHKESTITDGEKHAGDSDSSYDEVDLDYLIYGERTKSSDARKNAKRQAKLRKSTLMNFNQTT